MMNRLGTSSLLFRGAAIFGLLTAPLSALAFDAKRQDEPLATKEFFKPELYISSSNVADDSGDLRQVRRAAWDQFYAEHGADFKFHFDPRSLTPSNVTGHIPLVPGTGVDNDLSLDQLSQRLGRTVLEVDAEVVADLVRGLVADHKDALGIDATQLGQTPAVKVADHLWQVSIPQMVDGIPVRHARLAATINHGNLVLLGTETWGNVTIDTRPSITADQAVDIGFAWVGGQQAQDETWQEPRLEIVPFAPPEHESGGVFTGPPGRGYGHRLVWSFGFTRPPELAHWELLVDAHSGEVLAFQDTNQYETEHVTGGVYPLTSTEICPTNETCGTMQSGYPMPYANTGLPAPNNFTNAAGLFEHAGGTVTTTLNGRFLRILDNCGAISESATGSLDLGGLNGQHDCSTAGSSAGDTPAARSCFYEVNKLIEMAQGWLPANSWLQGQLTSNVNINLTCNAFWSPGGGTVNFYRSGGGCRNTGELAAVFDHEWGHGLDDNDANGGLSSSSEAYADIAAIYRLQTSCVGHGFVQSTNKNCGQTTDGTGFNQNESQTGTHCDVNCSGVRDADWAMHSDAIPDTPQNWNCVHCNTGPGPCGRQVHCSAAPSRQAAWDLVARDLRLFPFEYDSNTAFILGNKLFYQGSGNIGSWHACSCPSSADGCGATNAYMGWLAADDDNGNLNDGTPHMTALFAAFNRHNIACNTPTAVNSGCAGGPNAAPVLEVSTGSNQLDLSWNPVAGAVSYRVLRTEGHAGCNFGKALIATVSGTNYTDAEVANGRSYSYVVQAVGGSDACFSPASACITAAPQPCAGAVGLDRDVYNCSDSLSITLIDSDLTGTGSHNVSVRSTTEAAPETATLTENPPGSGRFTGTFPTSGNAPLAGNGAVSVADGGTVTVEYLDVSFCGTPNVTVGKTRPVDCAGPAISNVQALNVTGSSADITWTTNEPSDSRVLYDPTPPPVQSVATNSSLVATHQIHLGDLTECSLYRFSVHSTDPAQNSAADDNGGVLHTFETGRNVQPSFTDATPISIPDNTPAGIASTISVPDSETILDVDVVVNINHAFVGDLLLSLVGPDGTTVILSNRRGGSGDNFVSTVFDDEAATAIAAGSAPFNGSFRPDGQLLGFDGRNAQGTWSLQVVDQASGTSGSIASWTLKLTYPPQDCGPSLKFQSFTLGDTCGGTGGGGGNGIVETGEQILLPVVLRNNGTADTTGIVARLSTSTPGVTVYNDTASYPDLEPGASAGSTSAPFAFAVNTSAACAGMIGFTVEATSNEGSFADAFSVRVGTDPLISSEFISTEVPRPVPDLSFIKSKVEVTGTQLLADVDVQFSVSHTRDSDLDIFLVHPNGTRVELTTDNGGTADHYTTTLFDDEAGVPITSGAAPFSGRYRPEGTLSALDGLPANGFWGLELTDDASAEIGTLQAWTLKLTRQVPPSCQSCSIAAPVSETQLQWGAGTTSRLEWLSVAGATFYNVYRGVAADLPNLLDSNADSCLRDSTAQLSTDELDEVPAEGAFFWYLVLAGSPGGQGSAGNATAGPRVQNSSGTCP